MDIDDVINIGGVSAGHGDGDGIVSGSTPGQYPLVAKVESALVEREMTIAIIDVGIGPCQVDDELGDKALTDLSESHVECSEVRFVTGLVREVR